VKEEVGTDDSKGGGGVPSGVGDGMKGVGVRGWGTSKFK
jgi:hypothetical protein